MSLLDYFKTNKKPATAATAKERLQIIVAHQRSERGVVPDYFPKMKQEIIDVIRKYVHITEEQVSVQLDQNDEDLSVLEIDVTLPEHK